MCGRFAQYAPFDVAPRAEDALCRLDSQLELAAELNQREPRYNIAPTMTAAVLARNADRRLQVKGLRWGLIPSWARDRKIGSHGINARAETVAEKPMFRAAFGKRRCVVPMNGYFEWKRQDGGKQPYFIHAPDRTALLGAGIWEAWRENPAAEWTRTFALLTGAAGLVSGNIHDRQPVLLSPQDLAAWLDGTPADARDVLANRPESALTFHAVRREVGSVANQGAEVVRPLEDSR